MRRLLVLGYRPLKRKTLGESQIFEDQREQPLILPGNSAAWEKELRGEVLYYGTKGAGRLNTEPMEDKTPIQPVKKNAYKHPLYGTWHGMLQRCHNEHHAGWRTFGARGIEVCKRWREDFWAFVEDVGTKPEGTVLRMKDRSQGFYGPGNWEWAPRGTNAADGICRNTVRSRLLAGWSKNEAQARPPRGTGGMEVRVLATGTVKGKELKKVVIAAGPLRDCWKKTWECVRLCLRHQQACRFDIWKGNRKRLVAIRVGC